MALEEAKSSECEKTDESLVAEIQTDTNADEACALLYDRHFMYIQSIGWRSGIHSNDIDDFVNTVFFKAFSKIQQYRAESKFRTWLTTIALNEARTRISRTKRDKVCVGGDAYHTAISTIVPTSCNHQPVDDLMCARESAQIINKAISRLSDPHREIISMVILGTNYEGISAALGVEIGTVRSRLARARESLALMLGIKPSKTASRRESRWRNVSAYDISPSLYLLSAPHPDGLPHAA